MATDFYRRFRQLSETEVRDIARLVSSLLIPWDTPAWPDDLSVEDRFLIEDVLGFLDERYRLLLQHMGSTVAEESRQWKSHSMATLLALAFLCGLYVKRVPRHRGRGTVDHPVVIPDSQEGDEERPVVVDEDGSV
jgi:hypothetical protein